MKMGYSIALGDPISYFVTAQPEEARDGTAENTNVGSPGLVGVTTAEK